MNPLQRLLVFLIRLYQLALSPWLGGGCRFHPSCSRYAEDAVREHGAGRGMWLAARRLGKCHPWHPGGADPVPPVSASALARAPLFGQPPAPQTMRAENEAAALPRTA